MQRQLDAVRQSKQDFGTSVEEIWEKYRSAHPQLDDVALRLTRLDRSAMSLESAGGSNDAQFYELEAIILAELRPAYLIEQDKIQVETNPVAGEPSLIQAINDHKARLETVCRSVGRVDLYHHWSQGYAGTGWLIDEDVVVTNRHVAQIFAETDWTGAFRFRRGSFDREIESRVDYLQQAKTAGTRRRADVLEVLYVAGSREADIAFLRVETREDLEPLYLSASPPRKGMPVAAVGYPAGDAGRNDPALMRELFGDLYEVKRFSPGIVTGTQENDVIVNADYTSLNGSSGSVVLDLESGDAVGLHFAGAFRHTNYAVAADVVDAARARIKTFVAIDAKVEAPSSSSADFVGRDGYDAEFLGGGGLAVPLPSLVAWSSDVAPVEDDPDDVLKYRHFSVVQSASRRLPLVTAVNIDGVKAVKLKRKGSWRLDGRIDPKHQIGNELYYKNPLDRGHMVRRRDPGWGDSREEAQQAEIDTFHYTNSAPQHKDLNQRDWVGLEDYVLEAAETRGFKISVLTGPIFRDEDKTLRHQPGAEGIQIPDEFWKVVVMVRADTGALSATGYVLSHGRMIRKLTEAAFVFGAYETYQVQIARIESETGLDFGDLRDSDPLGAVLDTESPFGAAVRRIEGSNSLRLT